MPAISRGPAQALLLTGMVSVAWPVLQQHELWTAVSEREGNGENVMRLGLLRTAEDSSAAGPRQGELRELIRELHDRGLKAVADIVINHRCAHFQARRDHHTLKLIA